VIPAGGIQIQDILTPDVADERLIAEVCPPEQIV